MVWPEFVNCCRRTEQESLFAVRGERPRVLFNCAKDYFGMDALLTKMVVPAPFPSK